MAIMSYMRKQDKAKSSGRYGAEKLPPLLPEMQTGITNQHSTI